MFTKLFNSGFDSDASARERRLLFAATPADPNAQDPNQNEQASETSEADAEKPEMNPVDRLRTSMADRIATKAPEMILQEIKSRDDVVELLTISGALKEREEECATALGLRVRDGEGHIIKDLDDATREKREKFAEYFLQRLSDDELLRVIEAAESELGNAEKNMRAIEVEFKNKMNGVMVTYDEKTGRTSKTFNPKAAIDPSKIEQTIERISQYQSATDSETGTITQDNILEKIGLAGQYDDAQRKEVFKAFVAMAEARRKNRLFGVRSGTTDTQEARSQTRAEFSANTQQTIETLQKYLDVRLNARAGKLLDQVGDTSAAYDGETLPKGISADGVGDAVGDDLKSLFWVLRRGKEDEIRPGMYSKNGMSGAREAIVKLNRIETELNGDVTLRKPKNLAEKEVSENDRVVWASETAARLEKLDLDRIAAVSPLAESLMKQFREFFHAFKPGERQTEEDLIAIRQTPSDHMTRITRLIQITETNPKALKDETMRQLDERVPQDKLESVLQAVRKDLEPAIDGVLGNINHPTARFLNIPGHIENLRGEIESDLLTADTMREQTGDAFNDKAGKAAAEAQQKIKRLQDCSRILAAITARGSDIIIRPGRDEYRAKAGRDSFGFYSYEDGKIYLNADRIRDVRLDEEEVIEHEVGHAMMDAFRRSDVFPTIMLSFNEGLKNETTASGESLETVLVRQAPVWGIEVGNPASPTIEEKWKMMDELANRYSMWKEDGEDGKISDQERELFALCAKNQTLLPAAKPLNLTGGVHLDADDLHGGGTAVAEEDAPPAPERSYEENELGKAEKQILDIESFLEAYPEYKGTVDAYDYQDLKKAIDQAKKSFRSNAYLRDVQNFLNTLKAANETLKAINDDVIKVVDLAKSDLTHETKTGARSIWRIVTEDINWVSLSDVGTMFKDAWEDIQRMWKRRGEAARNRLGKSITEMIPDDVYLLGRLKHEFERRDRTSEEEEVGVWEKGLEKIDPHDLMHEMVPRVKSRDQLKAIIHLVTKKGRMDWDDTHLWDKLEYYSGYRMPRAACLRDADLRNQWLQKMTADIWRDKDFFEHSKAENDGAIDSGRKHLDPYVEELSATGRLRAELRRLLTNYTRMANGEKLAKEEEVNPHLYEGIIYYAMRNGKMSMEEKFFFLVKGVDIGILSVDRLRAFSGENFGILNSFPFIDYFSSGQNCSKHEIAKIAGRITEAPDGQGAQYKPGARMTKFLMEEVAFDKNVYDRVNKALKRAENIDHEDIPMLLTQVDYNGVNQIINFTSGSQAKVSAAAMQNGYVGYNSFLKYFAMKATIGHPPITDRDIAKIASTLGAYSMWDNLITRNSIGSPATARPFLSWEQINEQAPVSGAEKTRAYRDTMNDFTLDLARSLGINDVGGIPIDVYIGVDRQSGARFQAYKAANPGEKDDDIYKMIEAGPQKFVTALKEKLSNPANRALLVQILKQRESSFIPEESSFELGNVRGFWDEDGSGHGAAHGGGHGH